MATIRPLHIANGEISQISDADSIDTGLLGNERISVAIPNPQIGQSLTICWHPQAAQIWNCYLSRRGGTSVTVDIYHDADRNSVTANALFFTGETVSTDAIVTPTLLGNVITGGTWIWAVIVSVVGSVEELEIVLEIG